MPEQDWAVADRISDAIVDVINTELQAMRDREAIEPNQLLAGQLLALLALSQTMPTAKPKTLETVLSAARNCLEEMVNR